VTKPNFCRQSARDRVALRCVVLFALLHCCVVAMVQLLSESEGIEGLVFVVTGGAGHVGSALCLELARRGAAEVRSFDVCTALDRLEVLRAHGIRCITGQIFVAVADAITRHFVPIFFSEGFCS
jgi:5,10-methylene-tetrahydrofolate dehydrogenase/methenyl tetrahydrofolate cyclohydrolase